MHLTQFLELIPEARDIFELRYQMLLELSEKPLQGRRSLAEKMNRPERQIRSEIECLETLGLIDSFRSGLKITPKGNQFVEEFDFLYEQDHGLIELERTLCRALGMAHLRIARSDSHRDANLARMGVKALRDILREVSVIGITGGSSVHLIIEALPETPFSDRHVLPARGSIGQHSALQANSLAETLSGKIGATFYPLYAVDSLQPRTMEIMKEDPLMRETFRMMGQIEGLLFGIGQVEEMIHRRQLPEEIVQILRDAGATGEAFGCFFDEEGKLLYQLETFGIDLKKVKSLKSLAAIAYGRDKAAAVLSVSTINPHVTLITDEACARQMMEIIRRKKW